jgi:hypothetical protein
MAIMKGGFLLAVIGFVVGAALSYRAALLAEGLAVYRGWRTPGVVIFFHLLPLTHKGGEPPLWMFRVPIVVDIFSMICALVLLMSKVYRFYNS